MQPKVRHGQTQQRVVETAACHAALVTQLQEADLTREPRKHRTWSRPNRCVICDDVLVTRTSIQNDKTRQLAFMGPQDPGT